MRTRNLAFAAAGVLAATALSGQADTIHLTAALDGPQAGTISPATGTGSMTFDDQTRLLTWTITWSGLLGEVNNAHFHSGAPGVDGPIEVPITDFTSPSEGSATVNANDVANMLGGLWYINIHTTFDASGEIRGQVLVAPPDDDSDGVPNDEDNCPNAANPGQEDDDADTLGNACDNCTLAANADQRDVDGDDIGSLCDGDFNQSCNVDFSDLALLKAGFFGTDPNLNMNGLGSVDFADLGLFKQGFFLAPGPSGVPNDCSL